MPQAGFVPLPLYSPPDGTRRVFDRKIITYNYIKEERVGDEISTLLRIKFRAFFRRNVLSNTHQQPRRVSAASELCADRLKPQHTNIQN